MPAGAAHLLQNSAGFKMVKPFDYTTPFSKSLCQTDKMHKNSIFLLKCKKACFLQTFPAG